MQLYAIRRRNGWASPAGLQETAGRTNREIASELFLSTRTVDMHVRNLLRKLDRRSRMEAAHRAAELGLLVPSPVPGDDRPA